MDFAGRKSLLMNEGVSQNVFIFGKFDFAQAIGPMSQSIIALEWALHLPYSRLRQAEFLHTNLA